MSQIQIEKEKTVKKSKHKLSQIFIHATEKQCSGYLYSNKPNEEKEYCALGLGLIYNGYDFGF
jgi:hypothetical protein